MVQSVCFSCSDTWQPLNLLCSLCGFLLSQCICRRSGKNSGTVLGHYHLASLSLIDAVFLAGLGVQFLW